MRSARAPAVLTLAQIAAAVLDVAFVEALIEPEVGQVCALVGSIAVVGRDLDLVGQGDRVAGRQGEDDRRLPVVQVATVIRRIGDPGFELRGRRLSRFRAVGECG